MRSSAGSAKGGRRKGVGWTSWMALALAALAGLVSALGGAAAPSAPLRTGHAQGPPALPTIVTGTVTIQGQPAPAGTNVTALIAGNNCGDITVRPNGTYVLQVGGRPGNAPACDQTGAAIQFAVGGMAATGTTTRDPGTLKQGVSLAATGQAIEVPTPLPTPPPGATPAAAITAAPTLPVPISAADDDGDFAWWPLALAGVALVGIALVLARVRARG